MYETEKRQSPRRSGYQYELETKRIRVAVKPAYLDDQSDPEDDRYVWSYTVTIENRGAEPVQLLSRYWNIMDGAGRMQEVRGPGVVGRPAGDRAGRKLPVHQRLPAGDRLGHHERPLSDDERVGRELRGGNPGFPAGKPLRTPANPLAVGLKVLSTARLKRPSGAGETFP